MLGRTDSRRRLLFLLLGLIVASATLLARLTWWQVVQRGALATAARAQTSLTLEIPGRRGAIYDRSGTVLLATTVNRYILSAAPNLLAPGQQASLASSLVGILSLQGDAVTTLSDKLASGTPYVILARDLDEATADVIRGGVADGSLAGLSLEPQPARVYPQPGGGPDSSLAAQILGFVNGEGRGQYGVEQVYQDTLAGKPKVIEAQRDANNQPIPDTTEVMDPGAPGVDLRLTIDARLQLAVEQEALAAWIADRAVDVSAVVMDPYTGEIYAEATYPSYNANEYTKIAATDPSRFIDPVVSSVYEPGSVFKLLTAIAGLERGIVSLQTKVDDSGFMTLDGGRSRISDADQRAMGWIPFQDVVAYSRNVGAARVALALGKSLQESAGILYDTWLRLGFGGLTGIDVAGEVPGLVRDPAISDWRQIDVANGAFGQGIAVTPIQLATAYAAMVNGGTLVTPHVVEAIGNQAVTAAPRATNVFPPALAPELIGLMRHVVTTVPFYAKGTLVPGYVVGGKTGTAQIWDAKRGAWKDNIFNYTFVGYIGKTRPDLIVAVRIHEGKPTIARIGFIDLPVESFELFRRVATDAITTLDLDPKRVPTLPFESTPSTAAKVDG